MVAKSAGLLLYRIPLQGGIEVLIAHPGGPFWARRDDAAWSIPKGEYREGEDPMAAAYREFGEEVGLPAPDGPAIFLGERRQPGGKRVSVWALRGDLDVTRASSNTFDMEWPRGSGKTQQFPEVDRVEWMDLSRAGRRLLKGQVPFLKDLVGALGRPEGDVGPGSTTRPAG